MNISTNITSGTVYVVWKSGATYYNGSTFEAFNGSNWASNYARSATLQARNVNVTPPATATDYELRLQAGGSAVQAADAILDGGPIPVDAADLDTQLDAILAASGSGGGNDTIQIDGDSVEIN